MSRDRKLNRTQEVVSSILISSTNQIEHLARPRGRVFVDSHTFSHDFQCSSPSLAKETEKGTSPDSDGRTISSQKY